MDFPIRLGNDAYRGTEEGQRVFNMENDVKLSAKKKRALETASLGANPRSLTAISSADGAKILKKSRLSYKELKKTLCPKPLIPSMDGFLAISVERRLQYRDSFEKVCTFMNYSLEKVWVMLEYSLEKVCDYVCGMLSSFSWSYHSIIIP